MPEHSSSKHESPHDALIKALERVDDMEDVVIIYSGKDDTKWGSFDNDLTVAEALFMVESYKHWLMSCLFEKD